MAMSVYKYLEAFAKLEKRLSEGQEGSAATRGQPSIQEVRNKLDKFIRALAPRELQVCVMCVGNFCLLGFRKNKFRYGQNNSDLSCHQKTMMVPLYSSVHVQCTCIHQYDI